ncbi:hypothetical protein NJH24_23375 [Pseudomonas asiatica]|uniref:hypothetical protein n=1 Tax=Pseudomonas asiatica TaxID=2219225 RepID=UPI00209AF5D6|nr:hypothetical protein [Pseudomonas asiatica]MCO7537709.1 hypothetical protein [Pseudomonas asiatica]MCO7551519.1 hypothetical protein [Pseudomonas asiatica]MCO7562129.1 hypothetical protein [Pseudomonas asiatica]
MSEARAFLNLKLQNYHRLKSDLALTGHSLEKFDVLNSHIANTVVRSGELIIIGDPTTASCTSQEAWMMRQATIAHMGLMRNGQGVDNFFLDNFETLKSLIAHASMGAGVVSEGWSKYLKAIEATLMDIEKLHQQYLGSGTITARDQFYAKRSALFRKLEEQLDNLAAFGSGLRNKGPIKRMLGLSTKSYLHTGEIAGYANKVGGVTKAAELVKKGGYIGIALDVATTGLEIYKACTLGREEECRRAKYVESSAFPGGLTGTALGSLGGKFVAEAACSIFLGVTTGGPGALACIIIGGATGGVLGGKLGSDRGEWMGELLYEKVAK